MKGRAAGGGSRRRRGFRGGGLAGDAQTGAPGVNPTLAWVGEQRCGTCSPPVHTGQGVNAVPASIRFGFSCWGFYKVRPSYTRCSSGLRRSRAKPGHGAVAAQRRRPLTGLLGDLRTTGARAKRKRRSGRGSLGGESDGARRRRDVGGEVVPRVAAALEGEAAAVELRPF